MSLERVIETDVLTIGGGMAGGFAAIKAKEQGLDVTLVDKGYMGRSGAASFAGGYFVIFNPEWGHRLDAWMGYISTAGEYVNDREWSEIVLKESYERYRDLASWGVKFVEDDGKLAYDAYGPIYESRMMWRGKFTPIIRRRALEVGVRVLDRIMITDLLKQDGRVVGAIGFHTRSGNLYIFKAKATIVAAGSGIFKQAGYPTHGTNDGHAMLYRAGCEITGKEFSMIGGSVVAAYPAWRGHGTMASFIRKYFNAEGEQLDSEVSFLFPAFEVHAGRGPIIWNLDAASSEEIKRGLKHQRTTGTAHEAERIGLDITQGGKIPLLGGVWLGASVMGGTGGVWPTSTKCATSIPGLYAAGECCGTRESGGNYPGAGLALAGASVTGARAGLGAAEYASKTGKTMIDEAGVARLRGITYVPMERKGGFNPRWVTEILKNIMIPYFTYQVKHGERLQAALTTVKFLGEHIVPKLKASDPHELRLAHETKNMVLSAEMMLRASIFRTESRGTHYREDYPRRDDSNWLAWVKMKDQQGEMKLWKEPVPKAWWPDLAKPYEERYPIRFPRE